MKIIIDKDTCIGCGACESASPNLFGLKDGKAFVKKQPSSKAEEEKAKETAEMCPVSAIVVK